MKRRVFLGTLGAALAVAVLPKSVWAIELDDGKPLTSKDITQLLRSPPPEILAHAKLLKRSSNFRRVPFRVALVFWSRECKADYSIQSDERFKRWAHANIHRML